MKLGRVRGIRAFLSFGPNRGKPFCFCWTNLQHWTFKAWGGSKLFSPLFIGILRSSSSHHQPQQVSDRVGQESPGTVGFGRQGRISVNPPYALLGEEDRHQAAHLLVSHNWAKVMFLGVVLYQEEDLHVCVALSWLILRRSPDSTRSVAATLRAQTDKL